MSQFKKYVRKGYTLAKPWVPGTDMSRVSISVADKEQGSPKEGDMIAKNPKVEGDLWLVNAKYFKENLELMKE